MKIEILPKKHAPVKITPLWVKLVSSKKIEGEKGLGDTMQRLFGKMGGEEFKKQFKQLFGFSCGCTDRQNNWNELFPY